MVLRSKTRDSHIDLFADEFNPVRVVSYTQLNGDIVLKFYPSDALMDRCAALIAMDESR